MEKGEKNIYNLAGEPNPAMREVCAGWSCHANPLEMSFERYSRIMCAEAWLEFGLTREGAIEACDSILAILDSGKNKAAEAAHAVGILRDMISLHLSPECLMEVCAIFYFPSNSTESIRGYNQEVTDYTMAEIKKDPALRHLFFCDYLETYRDFDKGLLNDSLRYLSQIQRLSGFLRQSIRAIGRSVQRTK